MTRRLNWQQRQGPQDFDDTAPEVVHYDFDHRRNTTPGSQSWPEKFGPAVIKKAWKAGLVVIAYVEGFDHPVAATETRWNAAKCFEVKTLEGWRLPQRIRTVKTVKGLRSTGEYVE